MEIAEFRFPESPERGRAWMGEVIDYAAQLEIFPNMGHRISLGRGAAGEEQDVRRLLFKDVWIVYEVRQAASGSEASGPDEERPYTLVLTVRHVREKPDAD